jgi:hypothetical protein
VLLGSDTDAAELRNGLGLGFGLSLR